MFNRDTGDVIYSSLYEPMDVAGYHQADTGIGPGIINFPHQQYNMPLQAPWELIIIGTGQTGTSFTNGDSQSWRRTSTGVRLNVNQVFSEISRDDAVGADGGPASLAA